jgi:hypothetical protein
LFHSITELNLHNVHFLELIVKKREIKRTAKWGKGRKKKERKKGRQKLSSTHFI